MRSIVEPNTRPQAPWLSLNYWWIWTRLLENWTTYSASWLIIVLWNYELWNTKTDSRISKNTIIINILETTRKRSIIFHNYYLKIYNWNNNHILFYNKLWNEITITTIIQFWDSTLNDKDNITLKMVSTFASFSSTWMVEMV